MKIIHFLETDTLYIELCPSEVSETRDLDENTLLDLDGTGRLCAITIEHASERMAIPAFTIRTSPRSEVVPPSPHHSRFRVNPPTMYGWLDHLKRDSAQLLSGPLSISRNEFLGLPSYGRDSGSADASADWRRSMASRASLRCSPQR